MDGLYLFPYPVADRACFVFAAFGAFGATAYMPVQHQYQTGHFLAFFRGEISHSMNSSFRPVGTVKQPPLHPGTVHIRRGFCSPSPSSQGVVS